MKYKKFAFIQWVCVPFLTNKTKGMQFTSQNLHGIQKYAKMRYNEKYVVCFKTSNFFKNYLNSGK